jgi:hypothetical protein
MQQMKKNHKLTLDFYTDTVRVRLSPFGSSNILQFSRYPNRLDSQLEDHSQNVFKICAILPACVCMPFIYTE